MLLHDITEAIGNTPLIELGGYSRREGLAAPLLGKVEFFNPAGSIKDRAALAIITAAEESGALTPGGVIIEPTSGNTGIALAAIAAARGYRVILTMPESMSVERRQILAAYGAQLVLTPAAQGMQGALDEAERIRAELPGSVLAGQFFNPANPASHYATTGPELWRDTGGRLDVLVAGVGTGGTLSGTGRYLKEQNPAIHVVAVEPAASPLLSGGTAAPHGIQGIGANFVPQNFDPSVCDEIVPVADSDALQTARALARTDGLLVGVSSGAAVYAAAQLARRPQYAGKILAVLLPDTGMRSLSSFQ